MAKPKRMMFAFPVAIVFLFITPLLLTQEARQSPRTPLPGVLASTPEPVRSDP